MQTRTLNTAALETPTNAGWRGRTLAEPGRATAAATTNRTVSGARRRQATGTVCSKHTATLGMRGATWFPLRRASASSTSAQPVSRRASSRSHRKGDPRPRAKRLGTIMNQTIRQQSGGWDRPEDDFRKPVVVLGLREVVWVGAVIESVTGVAYHRGHVWKVLRSLGWTRQRPARQSPNATTRRS